MSQDQEQTPEQIGRAALASLTKSVNATQNDRLSETEKRDMKLKAQPNYRQPDWKSADSIGTESSPASTTLMDRLWELMTELYGHKWTSVHGMGDDSGNWAKIFGGVDKYQLGKGVRAWTEQGGDLAKWPPGAVELREFCLAGGNLGIPTPDAAWREAVEASSDVMNWKFTHPIVQEAARLTDWYSIRTGTPKAETVQNRFNKRYGDLTAKLQRGEPLVEGQKLLSQETAQSERERSEKANDGLVKQRIRDQGLEGKSPAELLAEMRAKLGIRR